MFRRLCISFDRLTKDNKFDKRMKHEFSTFHPVRRRSGEGVIVSIYRVSGSLYPFSKRGCVRIRSLTMRVVTGTQPRSSFFPVRWHSNPARASLTNCNFSRLTKTIEREREREITVISSTNRSSPWLADN